MNKIFQILIVLAILVVAGCRSDSVPHPSYQLTVIQSEGSGSFEHGSVDHVKATPARAGLAFIKRLFGFFLIGPNWSFCALSASIFLKILPILPLCGIHDQDLRLAYFSRLKARAPSPAFRCQTPKILRLVSKHQNPNSHLVFSCSDSVSLVPAELSNHPFGIRIKF